MNDANLIKHQFKKGQSGNPKGRPPTGRQHFLACFDAELLKHGDVIARNMVRDGKKRPIQFGRDMLIPTLPKEMLITSKDADGRVAVWRGLLEVGTSEKNDEDLQAVSASETDSKEVPDAGNP
jgi:hypothetical protein